MFLSYGMAQNCRGDGLREVEENSAASSVGWIKSATPDLLVGLLNSTVLSFVT